MSTDAFAYASYLHERDRDLLNGLSGAIYVLKIDAQGRLTEQGLTDEDVRVKRAWLADLLGQLAELVQFLSSKNPQKKPTDLALMGVADRIISKGRAGTLGIAELGETRNRLRGEKPLKAEDFRRLDRLQGLLEEENAEAVAALYNL